MHENILDEFVQENQKSIRRRSLIPIWIKIFIWIFMIFGAISIPIFILGLSGFNFELELYGYTAHRALSTIGVFLFLLYLFKGVVSYSLWFEKVWAVNLGIIDAIIGILTCIIGMANIPLFHGNLDSNRFRFEIIFLIPYLIKLTRIRRLWMQSS